MIWVKLKFPDGKTKEWSFGPNRPLPRIGEKFLHPHEGMHIISDLVWESEHSVVLYLELL